MAIDKIKPLGLETSIDGTDVFPTPTELDPDSDFAAVKGIAFENSDNTTIEGVSGVMNFKDTEITAAKTLKDAMERLQYKNVDLTNLTTGYVLTWNNTLTKFELLAVGSASGGVTPPFVFSKAGSCGQGTYMRVGESATSVTGQLIKGSNKIVELSISNGTAVTTNTTFQLQQRTAISTFSDIAGAFVIIPSGQYKASNTGLSISIGPDIEVSAYNKVGTVSGPNVVVEPILMLYIVPA